MRGNDTDAVEMASDAGVGETGDGVLVGEADSDAVAERDPLLDPEAVLLAVSDAVVDAVDEMEPLSKRVDVPEKLVLPERLAVAV